jgi:outer membrane protein OmpA-like peptidoglycan-associated protein
MTSKSSLLSIAAFAGAMCVTTLAAAQPTADGFSLNRFEPSERGSEWFTNESLDLRGDQRFAAGLVIDYGHKPLVLYNDNGNERSAIVENQLFGHVGGSVILIDRLRFGLNLPIAIYQNGEGGSTATQTFSSDNKTTIGDLRLTGDVRIVGEYGGPFNFAGGLQIFAPTGSRDSYTGDGKVRLAPRLMTAGDIDMFTYAARLGFTWRANDEDFAGSPMGSEFNFAAAAGIHADEKRLVVGPEIFGSTVVTDSDAVFARRTTPFEIVFGGHYLAAKQVRLGGGIGPGLTRAFGTPQIRVLASVEWVQPMPEKEAVKPPPSDRDGDGIIDPEDACPDVPGVRTDDPKTNGCPPPGDRDKDGIIDPEDACPDVPGVKTDDPKTNGCPPPKDRDGDGILDDDDACPDVPGVKTDDPKTNGCPPPKDTDGDGIIDPEDACPEAPGPRNDDPKKNGCPVARIEKGEIKIREQVQFAYNSDKILKTSDYILEAVQKILEDNPGIKKVEVGGHTDSKGSDNYNLNLSKRRAASVVKWLTDKKIDKKRLTPKGYGETQPIDSNDTEEGRANNRRVVFQITESDLASAATGESTPAPAAPAAGEKKPATKKDKAAPKTEEPKKEPAKKEPAKKDKRPFDSR